MGSTLRKSSFKEIDKILIDVNRFCGDVKQMLTPCPANGFTNFAAQTMADAIPDTISR